MTERQAHIAFNLTEKVGSATLAKLVSEHGSAVKAWEAWPKKVARSGGDVDWVAEEKTARRFGVKIVTMVDDGYPAMLAEAPGAPLVLYVKGSVEALSRPGVAMIGTRRATPYGRNAASRISYDLAKAGWSIISGLAVGIDAESHRGALDAGGLTVGVIGSGLDRFYPEENRELAREIVKNGGAVVSEFPFGRSADTTTFPIRNHVVAALATGVVAVEAPLKSGTLITTSIAADLGRTVMAVPARVTDRMSSGCLSLIHDGAVPVRGAADVVEALGVQPGTVAPGDEGKASSARDEDTPPYSVEEALVMTHVDEDGVTIDDLVRLTHLPVERVSSVAMELRIKGFVRFLPGNRISLLTQRR